MDGHRHRFDADPDPTFRFDADPDPDPDPGPTPSLHMLENKKIYSDFCAHHCYFTLFIFFISVIREGV